MNTAELKNDIHRLVVETDNSDVLYKIKTIFNSLVNNEQEDDWWYIVSEQEKISIKKGLEQLDNGERIPHAQVRQEINKLLKE